MTGSIGVSPVNGETVERVEACRRWRQSKGRPRRLDLPYMSLPVYGRHGDRPLHLTGTAGTEAGRYIG